MTQILSPAHATPRRSLAKTVSWRIFASLDTFVVTYLITGQLMWAGSIAGAEVGTKIALYYLHERGWAHIGWGFRETPGDEAAAELAPNSPP